jgi:hypothetical protein
MEGLEQFALVLIVSSIRSITSLTLKRDHTYTLHVRSHIPSTAGNTAKLSIDFQGS